VYAAKSIEAADGMGPGDPTFGALKLTPWRIELSALSDLFEGKPPRCGG
jgi:hypothetical protein